MKVGELLQQLRELNYELEVQVQWAHEDADFVPAHLVVVEGEVFLFGEGSRLLEAHASSTQARPVMNRATQILDAVLRAFENPERTATWEQIARSVSGSLPIPEGGWDTVRNTLQGLLDSKLVKEEVCETNELYRLVVPR